MQSGISVSLLILTMARERALVIHWAQEPLAGSWESFLHLREYTDTSSQSPQRFFSPSEHLANLPSVFSSGAGQGRQPCSSPQPLVSVTNPTESAEPALPEASQRRSLLHTIMFLYFFGILLSFTCIRFQSINQPTSQSINQSINLPLSNGRQRNCLEG